MRYLFPLLTLVVCLPAARAQECSTATIRGHYCVSCQGYVSPAVGAPQTPFTVLATIRTDWAGNVTGGGKVSVGGTILDQVVSGKAIVNPNCTGSVSYDQTIGGQPAPKLNIVFHVLDSGKEIRGMSVDPGTNLLCTLSLISKAWPN